MLSLSLVVSTVSFGVECLMPCLSCVIKFGVCVGGSVDML